MVATLATITRSAAVFLTLVDLPACATLLLMAMRPIDNNIGH